MGAKCRICGNSVIFVERWKQNGNLCMWCELEEFEDKDKLRGGELW